MTTEHLLEVATASEVCVLVLCRARASRSPDASLRVMHLAVSAAHAYDGEARA
jgi:hypothetical protein